MPKGVYKRKLLTEEHKRNIGLGGRGKIISKEQKRKISLSMLGNKFWVGRHHTKETKLKMRNARLGKYNKENCHFWKGGISFEPYTTDWTETLRISIRERDNYVCRLCGKRQGDILHHIHHIDYNKKNCNADNLITLCNKCHPKTNNNRKYWENHFKEMDIRSLCDNY